MLDFHPITNGIEIMKQFKRHVIKPVTAGFIASILLFIMNGVGDFCEYQHIINGNYKTPWYNSNWFVEPYTNFRLSQYKSHYEVKTNYIGNQLWIVKEIKVGDKEFWTIDYRYDLETNVPIKTH